MFNFLYEYNGHIVNSKDAWLSLNICITVLTYLLQINRKVSHLGSGDSAEGFKGYSLALDDS